MTVPAEEHPAVEPAAAPGGLPAPIRGVRAAFVFLTRVPVGGFPYRAEDWKWAAAHAPFVGAVVGAATGVLDRALSPIGEMSAALLAIGASMLITGAFHEDGLADTADALGGAYDRDRVLTILKDSRIGSFGAAALIVSIGARAALLVELGQGVVAGLVIAASVARVAPIWLMAALPYVTDDKTAKSRGVLRGGYLQAAVATGWVTALLAGFGFAGMVSAGAIGALGLSAVLVALATGWRYHRRVGGVTGDFLGATEQIGEVVALAVLCYYA